VLSVRKKMPLSDEISPPIKIFSKIPLPVFFHYFLGLSLCHLYLHKGSVSTDFIMVPCPNKYRYWKNHFLAQFLVKAFSGSANQMSPLLGFIFR
jgi:hypothetical protein